MKKIILFFSSILFLSLISTVGFSDTCTPGTSNFCNCYGVVLCGITNLQNCTPGKAIAWMQAKTAWQHGGVTYPAGIQAACAAYCWMNSISPTQCYSDCTTNTNYFISNCSFSFANLK